ncbi:MAG: PHP domain-containing protein [Erysipelotrichales bacterium]|nr:PHP domain-containing protein [Erysipelotrichales bacterium]
MVDLHLHTNFSDGEDNCLILIDKLKAMHITAFSITDHDTIEGNKEINKFDLQGLSFISGVEVSSIFKGIQCHLLGYDFDIVHPEIEKLMKKAKDNRQKKIDSVLDYLNNAFQITFTEKEIAGLRALPNCGRPHFAKVMINKGYGQTITEIFDKYLNKFKSPDLKIQAVEVIKAIKEAGGIVSLAHPLEVIRENKITAKELDNLIKELKNIGLEALECYHSVHDEEHTNYYLELAENLGLAVSGGSDYHGDAKPNVKLGKLNITSDQLSIFKLFRGVKK